MNTNDIIISKPEFIIKTYTRIDTKNVIENRYASGIIIVLRGKLKFSFEEYSVFLCENDAIYIPEGSNYNIICYEHAESLVINFHTVDNMLKVTPLKKIDKKIAEGIYEELNELLLKVDENHHMILATYHRLLSTFFDNKTPISVSEVYVIKAENIILNNFSAPNLCCNDIAKELNISEVYLRKLFIKHRNMPISKFLLKTRMSYAHHLILEGYSISETATNTGYCDIYQFSRAYKKYFGFSPSKTNHNHRYRCFTPYLEEVITGVAPERDL